MRYVYASICDRVRVAGDIAKPLQNVEKGASSLRESARIMVV